MASPPFFEPESIPAPVGALARLAITPATTVTTDHVTAACEIIRDAFGADDAYVVHAGDPHFLRVGSAVEPGAYEIKQKGYYLIWRGLAADARAVGAGVTIADRLVQYAGPLAAGTRPTHLVSLLPVYESSSELLVVRGSWPDGITDRDIELLATVRPLLASLVSSLLDVQRQGRQRRQLGLLAEVAGAFRETGGPGVLPNIATAVARAAGYDWVTITLLDPAMERIVEQSHNVTRYSHTGIATHGAYQDERGAITIARRMRESGAPLLRPDVFIPDEDETTDPYMAEYRQNLRRYWERAHILSIATFPLEFQEEYLGNLSFSSVTRREFDEDEVEFLTAVVAQAAAVIGGLRLHQALREANARLAHLAHHDVLTGLANRALFHERLKGALAPDDDRPPGATVALLAIDLDHFKFVNDTLGHPAGDDLLVAVAQRLRSAARAHDTVARFGGDEFAVLLGGDITAASAQGAAERMLAALRVPFDIAGREIAVSASIGVTLGSRGASTYEDLLREADVALYQAKAAGRGRAALFDHDEGARALHRLDLEIDFQRALTHGEFELHYQPEVDLATGEMTAVEALVRWRHPTRGLLAPDAFLPLAEQTGQIIPLGHWVVERACHDLQRFEPFAETAGGLGLAVNLSPRQLTDPSLVAHVERVLREAGVSAERLRLELTEAVLMDDTPAVAATLRGLSGLGVGLVIDDFGAGHSSLGRLGRLPVATLKIDRSLIAPLDRDAAAPAIVGAVVGLAHGLGMQVTAEGVETAEQLARVRALGCERAQGFYLARPLPATDLIARLCAPGGPSFPPEPEQRVTLHVAV